MLSLQGQKGYLVTKMISKISKNGTVLDLGYPDGIITVKNLPENFDGISSKNKYLVVTRVDGEYWYYGLYKSALYARDAVVELPESRYFFYIK